MTDVENNQDERKQPLSCQAGYLPVPLRCVPSTALAGIEIYLASGGAYSLYSSIDLNFGDRDCERLLDSGVEFVFVSVRDHQTYYSTIENSLDAIVSDPAMQKAKKAEILYATSIELADQLLAAPPGKEEIKRSVNLARNTVQLIMKDTDAFGGLYDAFNHDFYTASHLVNTCSLAISLGQKMGLLDQEILQRLGTGSLLHDIGKIAIPPEILNTPKPLTPEELEIIKTHVDHGREHLQKVMDLPPEILAVVTEHHERIDGSGYPKGLKHDQLSLMGRLAGIVDSFDAMTSVRPYRSHTFSVQEALQNIVDEAPQKYDEEMTLAFAALVEESLAAPDGPERAGGRDSLSLDGHKDGAQHWHYCFRMPVTVRRLRKIGQKITMGPSQKVIAHKMSCLAVSFLSDRSFQRDENIVVFSPKLETIGLNRLWAVVTYCRDHGDGWYTIDAQFPTPYPIEVVRKLKTVTDTREMSLLEEAGNKRHQ